ncbi:hypothetical protein ALQ28_200008 [Pseudomonas syringae pv. delphinii]|uniref:Uncharacterized protein n=1 Tax=Pseudomonas syringae pv. delphinii TaxID=192088 RepID=A0A3M4AKJ1_9PSED|nr:hypothetical protein ALQ28_200008 [Pseudomonas syringae pv. delphinii]
MAISLQWNWTASDKPCRHRSLRRSSSLVRCIGRRKRSGLSRKVLTLETEEVEGKVIQNRFFVSASNLILARLRFQERTQRIQNGIPTRSAGTISDLPDAYRSSRSSAQR